MRQSFFYAFIAITTAWAAPVVLQDVLERQDATFKMPRIWTQSPGSRRWVPTLPPIDPMAVTHPASWERGGFATFQDHLRSTI